MTVQDLINAALREARVIAPDEGPSSAESADCLLALNQLLDSLSAQGAPVPTLVREQFPMTGVASYTIGTGGTMNTPRPLKIRTASCVDVSGASRPVKIATAEEWTSYADKTRTGLFADLLWTDNAYPLATLWLAPKPSAGNLELYSYKPLTRFGSLSSTVDLPPGYERALIHLEALEVWPQFRQGDPPQSLMLLGQDAKSTITSLNVAVLGQPAPVGGVVPPPVSAPVTPAVA